MEIVDAPDDPRQPARICTPEDDAEAARREPIVALRLMRQEAAKESAAALELVRQVLGWRPEQIAMARRFYPMSRAG